MFKVCTVILRKEYRQAAGADTEQRGDFVLVAPPRGLERKNSMGKNIGKSYLQKQRVEDSTMEEVLGYIC